MCLKIDKKHHHRTGTKRKILEFHTTRSSVIIPILVSILAFCIEIYSVYYVTGVCARCLDICRLINTTFIPTHIATTTVFLYQHFSLANYYNNAGQMWSIDDMELKAENVYLTMVTTIILAFFYLLFSFKVSTWNQIILLIMQGLYIWILFKYSIRDRIVVYEIPIKNVVSY